MALSTVAPTARLRAVTPAETRAELARAAPTERAVRRRLSWVWAMLVLNILTFFPTPLLVPIPSTVGKVITQGALGVALLVALIVNRPAVLRPNLMLFLLSVLTATSIMMSVRGYFGLGSSIRALRMAGFVMVLWLISPWFGRADLFLARIHRRAMLVIIGSVLLGLAVVPGKAFAQGGRLGGSLWPVPPPQLAHYCAVAVGLTIVFWLTGRLRARPAVMAIVLGVAVLVLTHTRTALVGLLVGVLVATLSLFFSRRRARKALMATALVAGLIALTFAPFLASWFTRGQTTKELTGLTGRTKVWVALVAAPRSEVHRVFGYGMSNDSFNGLSIDSSWYSTYLDQGLFGVAVDGALLVLLLAKALTSPRGPGRAITLFLIVYCAIASITETGLGQPSSYMLDLTVAFAMLPCRDFDEGRQVSLDPDPI